MTRVILNLGLDGPTFGQSNVMTRDERAINYLQRMRTFLQHGAELSLVGDTLIVEGNLQFRQGAAALTELAESAEQDCVAAWFPDLQLGKLYGPRTYEWGGFDIEYFKMPVERRGLE